MSKGYEEMIPCNNLLICVGYLGKLSDQSNTKYKVNIADVLEIIGSKGINVIKAKQFSSELNAGLEWKLDKLVNKNILVPKDSVTYTDSRGNTSIRFTDYTKRATTSTSQFGSSIDSEEEQEMMCVLEEISNEEADRIFIEDLIKDGKKYGLLEEDETIIRDKEGNISKIKIKNTLVENEEETDEDFIKELIKRGREMVMLEKDETIIRNKQGEIEKIKINSYTLANPGESSSSATSGVSNNNNRYKPQNRPWRREEYNYGNLPRAPATGYHN